MEPIDRPALTMTSKPTMTPDPTVHFHVSIWRDHAPPHDVALRTEQAGFQVVAPEHELQAKVYSWPLRTDVWAGIPNGEVRRRLREKLFELLEVTRPPTERSLAVLGDFIAAAEQAIASGDAGLVPVPVGDATVELNPLLALVLHLKWLIRCFADRPGISVSIL